MSSSPAVELPSPTSSPIAASFTLPGATSNWHGFTWSKLPSDNPFLAADGVQLLKWRDGYVAYGIADSGGNSLLWTSPDGRTWNQVTSIDALNLMVAAAPSGLVAIANDSEPSHQVWSSSDGVRWQKAGSTTGLLAIDSIAGTTSGLVAVEYPVASTGKFPTSPPSVVASTDGVNWAPVAVGPGSTWSSDYVPRIQSGNNRFFLTVSAKNPADPSGKGLMAIVWWADDGVTWTRSTGPSSLPFWQMYLGRDGILVETHSGSVPGSFGVDLSTDGGKTWKIDNKFEPLGPTICGQGECSPGPDGAYASNGSQILAVKSDGHAWVSYEGKTWTSIAWNPTSANSGTFLVLPGGVIVGDEYGAAQ